MTRNERKRRRTIARLILTVLTILVVAFVVAALTVPAVAI